MPVTDRVIQVYEELATSHERQDQGRQRDLFLVLAADAALALGQRDRAERFRQRLLHGNPHHLLKPFGSFSEALRSPDVQMFVEDLRRLCPPETADKLLHGQRQATTRTVARPAPAGEPGPKRFRQQEAQRHTPVTAPPVRRSAPPHTNSAPAARRGDSRDSPSPYARDLPETDATAKRPHAAEGGEPSWVAVILFL